MIGTWVQCFLLAIQMQFHSIEAVIRTQCTIIHSDKSHGHLSQSSVFQSLCQRNCQMSFIVSFKNVLCATSARKKINNTTVTYTNCKKHINWWTFQRQLQKCDAVLMYFNPWLAFIFQNNLCTISNTKAYLVTTTKVGRKKNLQLDFHSPWLWFHSEVKTSVTPFLFSGTTGSDQDFELEMLWKGRYDLQEHCQTSWKLRKEGN